LGKVPKNDKVLSLGIFGEFRRQKSRRIPASVANGRCFSVGVLFCAYGSVAGLLAALCGLCFSAQCPPSPIGGGGTCGQCFWKVVTSSGCRGKLRLACRLRSPGWVIARPAAAGLEGAFIYFNWK